jgi:hypothetical protein
MECPHCGLINPDTALRCDCGHQFGPPPPPTAERPPPWRRPIPIPGILVAIGVLLWLGPVVAMTLASAVGQALGGPPWLLNFPGPHGGLVGYVCLVGVVTMWSGVYWMIRGLRSRRRA